MNPRQLLEQGRKIWDDPEKRLNWSTGLSAFWNLFIAFQNMISSIRYQNYWFGSFSAYYFVLGALRICGMIMIIKKRKNVRLFRIVTGIGIILISIVLGTTVDVIFRTGQAKTYPGFLIYWVALYTFWKFVTGIINLIRSRRSNDRFIHALRCISYADALVSMLMLQTSMLLIFGPEMSDFNSILNRANGTILCLVIFVFGLLILIPEIRNKYRNENEN